MPPGRLVRPPFSFAFQTILDAEAGRVFAHEALIRGPCGEAAATVLTSVEPSFLHAFDRDARISAINLAARLGLPGLLSLNFLAQALETVPDAIDSMLASVDCACSWRTGRHSLVVFRPCALSLYHAVAPAAYRGAYAG